jgi:hypothetical protein
MLFNGKLDAIDLMAIEYEERQEKLRAIVDYVRRSPETNVDISGVCKELNITLTGSELDWIANQIY